MVISVDFFLKFLKNLFQFQINLFNFKTLCSTPNYSVSNFTNPNHYTFFPEMNRHHFALFVRHCRLILLLRKNYNDGDLNIFLPAEWRWKIPQVCDNEWHQYTITVDTPKVDLFIDGVKFEPDQEDKHSNPEVIDDWPLHAAQGINTTLTIGACYQSSENRLKHGFRGDIASIKLSTRQALSEEEIRCGMNCAERLLSPDEKIMEPEQQVQMNSDMNEVVIEGSNRQNIEKLLQKIQYVNDKENPSLGRRNIQVRESLAVPKVLNLPQNSTSRSQRPSAVQ